MWITVAVVLLSVSCTGGDALDPPASDRFTPSEFPDSAGMEALLVGRLVVDPTTGCVGIAAEPAGASPAMLVQWPPDIEPRTDPVRLLDDKGTVIAREGDLLHLAGGSPASDAPPHPCGAEGRAPDFIVNKIESVS